MLPVPDDGTPVLPALYHSAPPFGKSVSEKPSVPKIKLKSVKASKKGKAVVKWKYSVKADGYQLAYSTSSSFYGAKTKRFHSWTNDSVTLKGLSRWTTYYVRIRAFRKSGGKTYYGKWSSAKSVWVK